MIVWYTCDEDGRLTIHFEEKPYKVVDTSGTYVSYWENSCCKSISINKEDLPDGIEPKWEDEEPICVDLVVGEILNKKKDKTAHTMQNCRFAKNFPFCNVNKCINCSYFENIANIKK